MTQRPSNTFSATVSAIRLRPRAALLGLTAFLLVGCSSNLDLNTASPTANDPATTTSTNAPLFDPSNGVIPLPNLLLTGTVSDVEFNTTTPAPGHIAVNPGVPLTPDKALSYINIREVGRTNAVSGITAPILIRFGAPVVRASVTPATIKVFQVIPDSNGLTEIGPIRFQDVSALFAPEFLGLPALTDKGAPTGYLGVDSEVQLNPRVALTPGSRYLYVVTDGVQDAATNQAVTQGIVFGFLKYVKGADTNASATSTPGVSGSNSTGLADLSDPTNPARVLGQTSANSLQQIYGNVQQGGATVISGYAKTMDDLVAGATPAIGGASETLVQRRNHIKLIGRFITTAAGAIVPDPAFPSPQAPARMPLETSLWAWANNANIPSTAAPFQVNFSTAESRAWNNGIGASPTVLPGVAGVNAYFHNAGADAVPHDQIGVVVLGTFESGDLNMDPAVVAGLTGKPTTGDLTALDAATGPGHPYNPGNSTQPGTGVLQASRNPLNGQLRGFYHITRNVPFVFFAPAGPVPPGGFPLLIFQHGISGQKEQSVAMANTACSVGYAVIAIDQPLHGALGNGRAKEEWSSNFISLPSTLNTRTNIQQAGFNLWRLVRVTQQPGFAPGSLQNVLAAASFPISASGATRYVSLSLGSIVGSYFLAGNSAQTGGTNIQAFLSVPGGRLAYLLRDSITFGPIINAGLSAVPPPDTIVTGSPKYNQFLALVQSVTDSTDPAYMTFPIQAGAPSRLSGRVVVQEAIGDTVIPNNANNYFTNSLAGRGILGSATLDTAPGFTQVRNAGAASPTVPFLYGVGGLKASVAPGTISSTGPTEGIFQFGSPTAPASHGMLLTTALAQRQMALWLASGKVVDPADTSSGFPIAPPLTPEQLAAVQKFEPVHFQIFFPQANQ